MIVAAGRRCLVFASPVAAQNSLLYTCWIEIETVALRSLAFVVPMALVAVQRSRLAAQRSPCSLAGIDGRSHSS